jgi:hypothetical protein
LNTQRERQALLVLGMHRSGTSAIAGALVKLGATPPKTIVEGNPDNPRGFFESVPIMQFHDELLRSAGTHWNDWRSFDPAWHATPTGESFRRRAKELLDAEFGDSPLFVLKDPRICRFVHFWLQVFRDQGIIAKPVLPVRIPLEVALSMQVREHFPVAQSLLLWLRHTVDAEAATRGMARAIVPYHSLLADWRRQIEAVARNAEVNWPARSSAEEREVAAFLTSELRHHECTMEQCRRHPDMHSSMIAAYEACIELAADPAAPTACAMLDRIRTRFDAAADVFGRLYRHHGNGELYQLRLALWEQTRTTERANDEVLGLRSALEWERRAAKEALDQVVGLRNALESERGTAEAARNHAIALAGTLETERNATRHALNELAETRARLAAENQMLEAARRNLEQNRQRLNAIEASTLWRMTGPVRSILTRYPRLGQLARQAIGLFRSKL